MRRGNAAPLSLGGLLLTGVLISALTMGTPCPVWLLASTITGLGAAAGITAVPRLLRVSVPHRRELERGQASEAVLIVPLILGVIFVIIQVGIWAHARNIAVYSAREGATSSAAYQSDQSPDAATQAALADNADGVLRSYSVTSTRTAESVTVTVRGKSLSLIPMVELPAIEQSVTVPVENYTP